jgi:hypothetical protein
MVRILPTNRLRRGFFAAGMCLALSACENPWAGSAPSLEALLSKGWLSEKIGMEEMLKPAPLKPVRPVYCYETIGAGDCYDLPLEDGGNRLVGYDGPAPQIDPLPAKPTPLPAEPLPLR